MKFIADNIRELSRKNKERNIKRSIRWIKSRIKLEAKDGENICIVDFYKSFSDTQQKIISDYFTRKGFKVEWRFNDRIVVRWV